MLNTRASLAARLERIPGDIERSHVPGASGGAAGDQKDVRCSVYVQARLATDDSTQDCEILNLSAGGAKLRLPEPVAVGTEVVLTIEGHGTFAAKVAWSDRGHMGLQFMGDRDAAARLVWDLVENPEVNKGERRFTRRSVLWAGELRTGGRGLACRVQNISAFGAKVRLLEPFSARVSKVTLQVERYGEFPGEVVWQEGQILGISFNDDPEDVAQIFGSALESPRPGAG